MARKDISIRGIQELQAYNVRAIATLEPRGATGRAIQYGTAALHRYAVAITHVITGSLRGSHQMKIDKGGERGVISINPSTRNPRTKQRPHEYGYHEHERGGSHAFYKRTEAEAGDKILAEMADIIVRGLE